MEVDNVETQPESCLPRFGNWIFVSDKYLNILNICQPAINFRQMFAFVQETPWSLAALKFSMRKCCATDRASDKLFLQEFDFVGFSVLEGSVFSDPDAMLVGNFILIPTDDRHCFQFLFQTFGEICAQDFDYFAKLS